jgi:anthranilate synthase component 2
VKILLIDNFDSFTYNLVQQIKKIIKCNLTVLRNDVKYKDINLEFDKLIISPGPKTPKDTGISNQLISKFYKLKPILGVCLGMQCINEVLGGKTVHSPLPFHGKISNLTHNNETIFKGIPQNIKVARYHSLIIDEIPAQLEVIATSDQIPMAIKYKDYPVFGVQFHPESFMTEYGDKIMTNFLNA